MKFFGLCQGLIDTHYPDVVIEDMYGEHFSKFYDTCITPDTDIALYLALVKEFGSNVLDLGCGTGRLTLPLLQAGVNVTAVDISNNMLSILREKTSEHDVKIINQDMCKFQTDIKHDLAILPISTIHIVEDKKSLFKNIYQNLRTGGAFVFCYNDYSGITKSQTFKPTILFNRKEQTFCILTEQVNLQEEAAYANIYLEQVNEEGETKRYVAASKKDIIKPGYLEEITNASGFRMIQSFSVKLENYDMVYKILLKM